MWLPFKRGYTEGSGFHKEWQDCVGNGWRTPHVAGSSEHKEERRVTESDRVFRWSENAERVLGFDKSSNGALCTFFFFFLMNFGLNQPFWLEPAILVISWVSPDTAWVGANQPDSMRIEPSLSHVVASRGGKKTRGKTRLNALSVASLARRATGVAPL